eukprot:gene709-388_t
MKSYLLMMNYLEDNNNTLLELKSHHRIIHREFLLSTILSIGGSEDPPNSMKEIIYNDNNNNNNNNNKFCKYSLDNKIKFPFQNGFIVYEQQQKKQQLISNRFILRTKKEYLVSRIATPINIKGCGVKLLPCIILGCSPHSFHIPPPPPPPLRIKFAPHFSLLFPHRIQQYNNSTIIIQIFLSDVNIELLEYLFGKV